MTCLVIEEWSHCDVVCRLIHKVCRGERWFSESFSSTPKHLATSPELTSGGSENESLFSIFFFFFYPPGQCITTALHAEEILWSSLVIHGYDSSGSRGNNPGHGTPTRQCCICEFCFLPVVIFSIVCVVDHVASDWLDGSLPAYLNVAFQAEILEI